MSHCIFCQIAACQAPASFVYEDDFVVAFMDINQPNPHKVLVIPREHRETIYDLDDDLAAAIFQATVKIARAIRSASACDGLNVIQFNGRAGGSKMFSTFICISYRAIITTRSRWSGTLLAVVGMCWINLLMTFVHS